MAFPPSASLASPAFLRLLWLTQVLTLPSRLRRALGRFLAPAPGLDLLVGGLPARGRAALEVGWFLHALVGIPLFGHLLVVATSEPAWLTFFTIANAALLAIVAAVLVVRGAAWSAWPRVGRVVGVVALVGIALVGVVGPSSPSAAEGPRVGVAPLDRGATAEVTSVVPGSPAAGRLQVGDRIRAVAGQPLAAEAPSADLIARVNGPSLPAGPAVFTVDRAGTILEVTLELPPPPTGAHLAGAFRATLVRNLALLCVLFAFLLSDRQRWSAIGLDPARVAGETRWGLPALGILLGGHFVVSVLISLLALAFGGGLIEAEVGQRRAVTDTLLAERLAWTAAIVLVGSVTEEVVFRGFLLPRLRHATGTWVAAIAIGVVAFGVGHLYEGLLATVQTAGIAVWLSLVFLWRRHLMPCIVAHVAFNSLALALAYLVLKLGLFERLGEILGS